MALLRRNSKMAVRRRNLLGMGRLLLINTRESAAGDLAFILLLCSYHLPDADDDI